MQWGDLSSMISGLEAGGATEAFAEEAILKMRLCHGTFQCLEEQRTTHIVSAVMGGW